MVTLDYEDHISTEYGFCGCPEFRQVKKDINVAKKKKSKKVSFFSQTYSYKIDEITQAC